MKELLSILALSLCATLSAQICSIDFKLDHPDGVYKSGERLVATAQLLEDGKPAQGKIIRCLICHDSERMNGPAVDGPSEEPLSVSMTLDKPGWVKVMAVGMDKEKKGALSNVVDGKPGAVLGFIGAMVDPLDIKQGVPEPEDFDAYWQAQKDALKKIPMDAKLVPIPGSPANRVDSYLTVQGLEGFRPVEGILQTTAGAKPKSLPIMLHVHGVGVHWPSNPHWAPPAPEDCKKLVRNGVIFLNLNAHGIPNDQPVEYYKKTGEGELKNYMFRDSSDRDKYYMKGMIVRLARALEYLKTLPEWDGKNIIVSGGSQGGAQALIAGGVDPQVSYVYADVPAMCDHGGLLAGHANGWPRLYYLQDGKVMVNVSNDPKEAVQGDESIFKTAGYFDAANFAKRIKGEAFLRAGGNDGVCPPSGVFAAYNNIPSGAKKILFAPQGGHCSGIYQDQPDVKTALFVGSAKQ